MFEVRLYRVLGTIPNGHIKCRRIDTLERELRKAVKANSRIDVYDSTRNATYQILDESEIGGVIHQIRQSSDTKKSLY